MVRALTRPRTFPKFRVLPFRSDDLGRAAGDNLPCDRERVAGRESG